MWSINDIPDQTGRLAVISGANSGIGYVTARELARRGATVVLACRDVDRAETAAGRIREETAGGHVEVRRLDLASLSAVREFAAEWDLGAVDILVNNAGIAMVPYRTTEDGFESHFGVNQLGTFALTGGMLPHLLNSRDPRVVTLSSEGRRSAKVDMGNLNAERGYRAARAYLQSKKANVYFAVQLQRWAAECRLPLRSVVAVPGLTRTTVLNRDVHRHRGWLFRRAASFAMRHLAKPPEQGAWSSLYAATVPDLLGASYVAPSGVLEFRGPPVPRSAYRAMYDLETARALWRRCEELTAVEFRVPASA